MYMYLGLDQAEGRVNSNEYISCFITFGCLFAFGMVVQVYIITTQMKMTINTNALGIIAKTLFMNDEACYF